MKRTAAIAGTAAVAVAIAAGAGAALAGGKPHEARTTTLNLTANPNGQLSFDKRKLSAKHGTVTIKMVDPASSGIDHGIAVAAKGFKKVGKVVHPGKTSTLTLKSLKAGKYTFYCPVTGHRAAGMKGTLTIK